MSELKVESLFIGKYISIKEAINKLDQTAKKILIVVENDNKLIGILTDGDIRRWIIKNGDLNDPIEIIMSKNPKYIEAIDKYKAKEILKENSIEAMPILNRKQEVIDIVFWDDEFDEKLKIQKINSPVVIMAGGKGTRLHPYTKVLPKPLIPIGDTPIVERIIDKFNDQGCDEFYMTVNHKKNMIKAYFNEIEKEYTIKYIEENKPLGTAGSLYFIKDKIKEAFFLSNCDILIDGNYSSMIRYHKESESKMTLITSLKHHTIPYGVMKTDADGNLTEMIEKPEYDYLINTGMYILEPEVLEDIPKNEFFHITDLINEYIKKGEKIGIYPVSESSWLDMGEIKEMENMIKKLGLE